MLLRRHPCRTLTKGGADQFKSLHDSQFVVWLDTPDRPVFKFISQVPAVRPSQQGIRIVIRQIGDFVKMKEKPANLLSLNSQ